MTQPSRTFRLFVSSTFSDLQAERNVLQEKVFPRLRELASMHGCRFQAIDLRWGISDEAAIDQQTMNICLGEIKRCQKTSPRPNFIVLLGDRFGWCPPPAQIPHDEFEAIRALLSEPERRLLTKWYRLDQNAVPAEYCLLPRVGEMILYEHWEVIEQQLRNSLEKAAVRLNLRFDQLLKYTASATEQEIEAGAMQVANAREHVFCFFRHIEGLPLDGRAMRYIDLDDAGKLDWEAANKQANLKARLDTALQDNVFHYTASWKGNNGISTDHIGTLPNDLMDCQAMLVNNYSPKNLCEAVWCSLANIILKEVSIEEVDPLQAEVDAHLNFGQERTQIFIGREDILVKMLSYLTSDNQQALVIRGESGTGKSALMAKSIEQAKHNYPQANIVYRFIGTTPESSTGRSLLESLCRQIMRLYDSDETKVKVDYNDLVKQFREILALATSNKRLYIFLDALDQLSDQDHLRSMIWLPEVLPANVKIIITTLKGTWQPALEEKINLKNHLDLQALTAAEGEAILDAWLSQAKRSLQPAQNSYILNQFARSGSPLYLKLAFEEARRWKSYDAMPPLSDDIQGIISQLLDRLSKGSNHGEMLVNRSLGFLSCAKNGLTEDELLDTLSRDQVLYRWFLQTLHHTPQDMVRAIFNYLGPSLCALYKITSQERAETWYSANIRPDENELGQFLRFALTQADGPRLPIVLWSRLYFDLKPYLTERAADGTSVITFYHKTSMLEALEAKLFSDETEKQARHKSLAEYFVGLPTWQQDALRKPSQRKAAELVYQQVMAKLWRQAYQSLTDFQFLEARCRATSVYDLESDYHLALESWTGNPELKQVVNAFEKRLRLESHTIHESPELLFAHLYNHLTWLDKEENGPIHALCEQARPTQRNWLRMVQDPRPQTQSTSQPKPAWVTVITVTPDGKQVISGSVDSTIRVWDLESETLVHTLRGHSGILRYLALTPDGKRLISYADRDSLKVWDLLSGTLIRSISAKTSHIYKVTPDGRKLVTGWEELNLWDLDTGKILRSFEGHLGRIGAVAVSPDGRRLVSGSADKTVRVWELASGELLYTLEGHEAEVTHVIITPDGQWVVSGSTDETLKVWDLIHGRLLHTLEGHKNSVTALALLPDGLRLVSGSRDKTLKVWDLASGRLIRSIEGLPDEIKDLQITDDGTRVVCEAGDLLAWDIQKGRLIRKFKKGLCFSLMPNERQILVGGLSAKIMIIDLEKGQTSRELEEKIESSSEHPERSLEGHIIYVISVKPTPDGRQVISSAFDEEDLKVWDVESGQLAFKLEKRKMLVHALVITPDGKKVIGLTSRYLLVWDMDSRMLLQSIEGKWKNGEVLAVTPDEKVVFSISDENVLKVWDMVNGRLLHTFEGHNEQIEIIAISPDGQHILSASTEKELKVWELSNGQLVRTLKWQPDWGSAAAVLPSGQQVILKGDALTLWDLTSGQLLHKLNEQSKEFGKLTVTTDGQEVLFVLGETGSVKVWNLMSNTSHSLYKIEAPVVSLCITPDSRWVTCGDAAGKVWIFEWMSREIGSSIVVQSPDGMQAVEKRSTTLSIIYPGEVDHSGQIAEPEVLLNPLEMDAVNAQINDLKNNSNKVRSAAAEALGNYKDNTTIEKIGARLMVGNKDECEAALQALSYIHNAHAVKMIFNAYHHLHEVCPMSLIIVINKKGDLALKTAIESLNDECEAIRSGADAVLRSCISTGQASIRGRIDGILKMKSETERNKAREALRRFHLD